MIAFSWGGRKAKKKGRCPGLVMLALGPKGVRAWERGVFSWLPPHVGPVWFPCSLVKGQVFPRRYPFLQLSDRPEPGPQLEQTLLAGDSVKSIGGTLVFRSVNT